MRVKSGSESGNAGGPLASRGRLFVLATCVLAALVFGVTLAQGAKEVTNHFGSGPGSLGAQFSTPRDVAVNETGAGVGDVGDVYVADDANHRVQAFDSAGNFKFAIGRNVIATGAAGDLGDVFEKCVTASDCQAGSFGTTGDAPAGEFDNPQGVAVNQVTGDLYVRDRDNRRVQQFDAAGNFVRTWGFGVATGAAAFEICTANCLPGLTGAGGGQFATTSSNGTGIAISPATQDVFVGDPQNRRVQQFESDGDFVRGWGWDVDTSDGASTNVFEVCTAACRAGQTATPNTSNGQFGTSQPLHLAVDSAGIVYASDSTSANRVMRFDVDLAGAPGNAAAALMPAIAAPPLLTGATSGIEVDPDSDGGGADEDVLHVLRDPTAGSTVVQQFGPVNDPGGAVAPADDDDQHAPSAGFGAVTGLGIDSVADRLFVATTGPTVGASGHRVYVLGDAPAPAVTLDPVSDPGSTSATLEGSIDANGALTGYHFELSTDGGTTWSSRPTGGDVPFGAEDDAEDVSYELDGLDPGTEYDVRLVAKQTFGASTGTSSVETFTTDSAAPVVSPISSVDAGTTTATLTGQIDPSGEPTTYRFEYGPTDEYGSVAPDPDGDLAAGHGSSSVGVELSGLEPATTYHYRLVAENGTGETEGGDHVFTTGSADSGDACPNEEFRTGPSALLPNCRAYEQVSPVDKNGGEAIWQGTDLGGDVPFGARAASLDGERVLFASTAEFAGASYGGSVQDTDYLAVRGDTGWTTEPMVDSVEPAGALRGVPLSAPDLSRSLLYSSGTLQTDPPDTGTESIKIYTRDNLTGVTSPLVGIAGGLQEFNGPTVSRGWGHLVFGSKTVLTVDPTVPGMPGGSAAKVYEKVGSQLRLASVAADGSPFPYAQPGSAGIVASGFIPFSTVGAVSDDGRHVFVSAGAHSTAPRDIYRRTDGSTTAAGSPSQRSAPDPAGAETKIFRLATGDGNRVLFTSAEQLTDDANTGPGRDGVDLYRYDFEAGELIDISATEGGDGAQVQGVVGASEAGDRVYFAALGQVVPGEGDPTGTVPNLYLWEDDGTPDGSTRFVATLSAVDDTNWRELDGGWTARTTGDGRHLLFQSDADIPGHDNGGVTQIYRYDADSGGSGDLACISCNPSGATPIGPASMPNHVLEQSVQPWELPRSLSADGRRVFFNTADSLLPGDGNGKIDAYMWEDGDLSLLSTGTSARDSRFYNASTDGNDAFILTDQALVAQDRDNAQDLYDARVGGGFEALGPRPDCDGAGCQGAGPEPPPAGGAGSESLDGRGDVDPGVRLALSLKRPTRAQLARLARGKAIGLRVRVNRATKVRVVVRRGRTLVARRSARAKRAGVVVVKLRLNRRGRLRTGGGGSMRLSFKATAQGARARSMSVRIGGSR